MKKLMILLFAVCSSMVLFAANGNVTEGTLATVDAINVESTPNVAEKMILKLKSKITITASQEASITTIAQNYSFEGLSKAERKTKLKQFKKEVIRDVLTDAQKAEFKSKRKK